MNVSRFSLGIVGHSQEGSLDLATFGRSQIFFQLLAEVRSAQRVRGRTANIAVFPARSHQRGGSIHSYFDLVAATFGGFGQGVSYQIVGLADNCSEAQRPFSAGPFPPPGPINSSWKPLLSRKSQMYCRFCIVTFRIGCCLPSSKT